MLRTKVSNSAFLEFLGKRKAEGKSIPECIFLSTCGGKSPIARHLLLQRKLDAHGILGQRCQDNRTQNTKQDYASVNADLHALLRSYQRSWLKR